MATLKQDPGPVLAIDSKAESEVIDWRPDASSAIAWNLVAIGVTVAVTVAGLFLFALPVMLRSGSVSGSFRFGLVDILLVVGLTALLMVPHEALHGLVMRGFGARPRFGAMLVGHVLPPLYATADGHEFTRNRYLVMAATPPVAISVLGLLACFGQWAAYLIVPLAIHLSGCVGDGFAVLRTLREPSSTTCEDLRDGIRLHRTGAAEPAHHKP